MSEHLKEKQAETARLNWQPTGPEPALSEQNDSSKAVETALQGDYDVS